MELNMSGDFFNGIAQWDVTIKNYSMKIPVFFYDNTSMTAIYTASTKKVLKFLPHPQMKPLELFPGKCLVAFMAFEYRKTDIAPYNEFSISIPIAFGNKPVPGFSLLSSLMKRCFTAYIWHLPVTTEIARVGGVDVLGYPKIVADISFKNDAGWRECVLSQNKKMIVMMKVRELQTARGKPMKYRTYSLKDGVPIEATIHVNPIEFAETRNRAAAQLEIGSGHSICDEINEIELSKTPLMVQYSPLNQAVLFFPRSLAERKG